MILKGKKVSVLTYPLRAMLDTKLWNLQKQFFHTLFLALELLISISSFVQFFWAIGDTYVLCQNVQHRLIAIAIRPIVAVFQVARELKIKNIIRCVIKTMKVFANLLRIVMESRAPP